MDENKWIEVLENKFGKIGEVVRHNVKNQYFPEVFHYDFITAIVMQLEPSLPILPREEVKLLFEETVTNASEREEETLKGAIGYIISKHESAILAELLETQDVELLRSYGKMKEYMEDIWLTKL